MSLLLFMCTCCTCCVFPVVYQVVVAPGVTGATDCLVHLICDPGGGRGLFVNLFCFSHL